MSGILQPAQKALQTDTIHELGELRALIRLFAVNEPGADTDVGTLDTAVRQLEQPFLLVVFGEFNSGKSTLINARLGRKVMDTGPLPTTDMIYRLEYGDHDETSKPYDGLVIMKVQNEILRDVVIVDTPGIGAIIRKHEEIALAFIPSADLVLFVTTIDRPLAEDERQFLARIREWGRRVIFVLSKIDQKNEGEIKEVQAFIETNVKKLLGFSPTVFPVAAAPALIAKQTGDRSALAQSRIEALESFIHSTLTEKERFRLKIMNTVNSGLRLSEKYVDAAESKLETSKRDADTVKQNLARLDRYDRDTSVELSPLLDRISDAAGELKKRAQEFVDKTIRVRNAAQLVGGHDTIRREFESQVINGFPSELDNCSKEIARWLSSRDTQLRQSIIAELRGLVALRGSSTGYPSVLDGIKNTEADNLDGDADKVLGELRKAVCTGLGIGVGGLALGTAVVALTHTLIAFTGGLAGLAIAGLAGLAIPYRRKVAKRELHERIETLVVQVRKDIQAKAIEFAGQTQREVREAIEPCVKLVTSERDRCSENCANLRKVSQAMAKLRDRIGKVMPEKVWQPN